MTAPKTSGSMARKLVAILSADVAGYSRLTGADEEATVHTLHAYREVTDSRIQQHRGRIVNTAGDSVLAEFASAVDAVRCAVEIQQALKAKNADLPAERKMEFRIGINVGDVVVEGEEIYGGGVNVAARLQALADPGGIFISGTAYDQVKNKLALRYEDLGEQQVKNIAEPVRVYRVVMDEAADAVARQAALRQTQHEREPDEVGAGFKPAPTDSTGKQKRWVGTARLPRTAALAVMGVLLLVGIIVSVQYLSFRPPAPSANIPPAQPSAPHLPDKPSIAVMPFKNVSGDPEQEYFGDGITVDLITDLTKLSGLTVIFGYSVFPYKGKTVKVQEVSRELRARYVLEGSVRTVGDRVLISAQLSDGT
ncbi:MAG: adenylate/guanylate cyclase domain-containing protein, partial [Deltaproteobacteria bacterium]|nr:adenylate/guanylate cyclase domain-containing protein [Deltaproteobacteria bacterium]